MLKLNSKKAAENLHKYMMQDFDYLQERAAYQGFTLGKDAGSVCRFIWKIFCSEYGWEIRRYGAPRAFREWAQGLALGGMFDYYLHSAVDTLGGILEESEEEKARFTEAQAEDRLTGMIYRAVEKAGRDA